MELSPLIYCCEIFVVLTASHLVSPDGIFTSSHPWGFAFFRAAYWKTNKLAWGRLPRLGGGAVFILFSANLFYGSSERKQIFFIKEMIGKGHLKK